MNDCERESTDGVGQWMTHIFRSTCTDDFHSQPSEFSSSKINYEWQIDDDSDEPDKKVGF